MLLEPLEPAKENVPADAAPEPVTQPEVPEVVPPPEPEPAIETPEPAAPEPPPDPEWYQRFVSAGKPPLLPELEPPPRPQYIPPPYQPPPQQYVPPQPTAPPPLTFDQLAENPNVFLERAREIAKMEAEALYRPVTAQIESERRARMQFAESSSQRQLYDMVTSANEFYKQNVASDPAYADPKFRAVADTFMATLVQNAVQKARMDVARGEVADVSGILNQRMIRLAKAIAHDETGVQSQQRRVELKGGGQGATSSGKAPQATRPLSADEERLRQRLGLSVKQYLENEKASAEVFRVYPGGR